MPSDFLYIDTNFPKFSGNDSLPDRVSAIQNYVFILVEQLRYSLANLDTRNWNQDALDKYSLSITEPISISIGSIEEDLTQIKIDAEGLALRVSNAEGDITQLGITAQGLAVRVENAEGDITQLGITAQGLTVSVQGLDGKYNILQATVDGFTITGPSGTTLINGASISTGSITTDSLHLSDSLSVYTETGVTVGGKPQYAVTGTLEFGYSDDTGYGISISAEPISGWSGAVVAVPGGAKLQSNYGNRRQSEVYASYDQVGIVVGNKVYQFMEDRVVGLDAVAVFG